MCVLRIIKKRRQLIRIHVIILLLIFCRADLSIGTLLYIPSIKANAGQTVNIPIMIDDIKNMAGIKLILKYDPKILEFRKGSKTKYTSSLMHVLNDKTPGVLIIVMAGAKGIQGKEISLFSLTFNTNADINTNTSTRFSIQELQVMSDDLKEVKAKVKVNDLEISASEKSPQMETEKECTKLQQPSPKELESQAAQPIENQ